VIERELDSTLFLRDGKRLRLSPSGRALRRL
jgi:DNA-binding transcriptional LysR family regulator